MFTQKSTTSTASSNNTARLYTPLTINSGLKCIQFYYNMFGSDANNLNVYLSIPFQSIEYKIWSKSTDNGNKVFYMIFNLTLVVKSPEGI